MKRIISIKYGSNACEALLEEKHRFLRAMLEIAGINISGIWNVKQPLTKDVENALFFALKKQDFYYSNKVDSFDVYFKNKLFGRMEVVNKKLRKGLDKKIFLDITVEITVNEEIP